MLHSTDLNPLQYSVWDTLQQLVCEGRCELFRTLCYFRQNAMMSATDSQWEKRQAAVAKDLFSTFCWSVTDDSAYCDVLA